MPHWADMPFGAHCSTGLGYTPVPRSIPQSSGAMDGHRECAKFNVHVYTPPEQPCQAAVPRGLLGSVLDYGATSQFAFSIKALFRILDTEKM